MYTNTILPSYDNYNDPSLSLMFLKTTSDSSNIHATPYINKLFGTYDICNCKNGGCVNQIIYTRSDTNYFNFSSINNGCEITACE